LFTKYEALARGEFRLGWPPPGLALGVPLTAAGVALWCDAKLTAYGSMLDESMVVGPLLVGIFATIYVAHELRRR
jgi:hypothetical protein